LGDNEKTLNVYLTNIRSDRLVAVRSAIASTFGAEVIPQKGISPLKAKYGFLTLQDWYRRMVGSVLNIRGVTYTDIDEARNRLGIGVESSRVTTQVLDQITKLNIPPDAVTVIVTGPVRPLIHNVQLPHKPRQGGYVITRLTVPSGISLSTLGFNAVRQGVQGFVTCSHCTDVFWSLDSPPAVFYQAPGFFPAEQVGTEAVDPTGFPCPSMYPAGSTCRYSDSAFVQYDPGVQSSIGIVARTTGLTTNCPTSTLTVSHGRPPGPPMFAIASAPSTPYLAGVMLNKVGQSSGLSRGPIAGTCQDYQDSQNRIRLCQYSMGQTGPDRIATFGDSGAAVFRIKNQNFSELYGSLWGGFLFQNSSCSKFIVFSPIGGVSSQQSGIQSPQDLGPLGYICSSSGCFQQ
jgi:hypothetical protein